MSGATAEFRAYIVGYPILVEVLLYLGPLDSIVPAYSMFDLMALNVRVPPGLSFEDTLAVGACLATFRCNVAFLAYHFVPLAIVWSVAAKLFDGPPFAAPARPTVPKFLHLGTCLVLLTLVDNFVVNPLLGSPGLFDYWQRWTYLPEFALIDHLGWLAAGCLATRHAARIRGRRDPAELFDAVLAGDVEALGEHLSAGLAPNVARDEDGASPLHVAAGAVGPEIVSALLAVDADPRARDHAGATPLHVAAAAGAIGAIAALLDAGADPDAQDGDGRRPLVRAEENGHVEAIAALRKATGRGQGNDEEHGR